MVAVVACVAPSLRPAMSPLQRVLQGRSALTGCSSRTAVHSIRSAAQVARGPFSSRVQAWAPTLEKKIT